MIYVVGIVGVVFLLMAGWVKIQGMRIASLKTDVATAEANVATCKSANATLAESIKGVRGEYKGSQDALTKIQSEDAKKQAAARAILAQHQKAAQDSARKVSELQGQMAGPPAPTREAQCEAVRKTLSDLRVDQLRDHAATRQQN